MEWVWVQRVCSQAVTFPVESNPALHLMDHRRAERLPAVLVRAHPLHADRRADGLGEQGCIGRGVVRAVVAVAAGRFHVDHVHGGGRQAEQLGDRALQLVDALRSGPDRGLDPFIGALRTSATAQEGPIAACIW